MSKAKKKTSTKETASTGDVATAGENDVAPSSSSDRRPQPLDLVEWVDPESLRSNDYNPNKVFRPEMELLKLSILSDGWTQPVVATPDGTIVDGFHRWSLARRDPEIRAMSGGLVPVVRTQPASSGDARAATVRHNRARGQHGILSMGKIVREMQANGMSDDEVCKKLGMEPEELIRLADERTSSSRMGKESFGRGWVPINEKPAEVDRDRHNK